MPRERLAEASNPHQEVPIEMATTKKSIAGTVRNGRTTQVPETWDAVPWTTVSVEDPEFGEYLIEVAIVRLTVTLARAFIASEKNRPLSPRTVDGIVADIEDDNFRFTGEPIIFDWDGNGRNGQNRCHAVIKTGKPILTLAIRGIDPDAFDFMDRNKVRSKSDVLAIHGEKCYCLLAAAATHMWRQENELQDSNRAPRPEVCMEMVRKHPLLRDGAEFAFTKDNLTTLIAPSAVAYFYAAAIEASGDREAVESFLASVCSGTNLKTGTPAYLFRRLLENNATQTGRGMTAQQIIAVLIKAWNLHRTGQTRKVLVFKSDEPYPTINKEV